MSTNPACCPRCKAPLVTRNGEGIVVAKLTLQPVEDHGEVCGHCAKAIRITEGLGPTRRQLMATSSTGLTRRAEQRRRR